MDRPGPDIICSMDVDACRELVDGSRILHSELGGNKGPTAEEQVTMDFAFASVVTTKQIRTGDLFTEENIWVKRPGTGELLAERYEEVLGKRSLRDLDIDTHLSLSDVGWVI
jgi:N-acetylneuraminate synthase